MYPLTPEAMTLQPSVLSGNPKADAPHRHLHLPILSKPVPPNQSQFQGGLTPHLPALLLPRPELREWVFSSEGSPPPRNSYCWFAVHFLSFFEVYLQAITGYAPAGSRPPIT